MKTPPLPKRVNKTKTVYPALSYGQTLDIIHRDCPACITNLRFGSGPHHVVLLPEAWDELCTFIHYGKRHPANVLELQLQGLGHIFIHNECIIVVVSHFAPIPSASASRVHATLVEHPDDIVTLQKLSLQFDQYIAHEKQFNTIHGKLFDPFLRYGSSQVVVFCHTHPDLGCFFSQPDHAVHRATEDFPAVSLVCDPIRKDFKAMVGVKREGAVITVCAYASDESIPATQSARWLGRVKETLRAALRRRKKEVLL